MNAADGAEFRSMLAAECGRLLGREREPALLFSGGTDSLTVLWALLDLGAAPTCYVFRLEEHESSDARAARAAAAEFGAALVEVVAPAVPAADLAREVAEVVRLIGSARKTHVEVMWAYWHLLRRVEERSVFAGLQADTLYGSSRSMAVKCARMGAPEFAAFRRRLLASRDQEGLAQAEALCASLGKVLRAPYASDAAREFMLRFSWRELNRPRQKMPAVLGFRPEFGRAALYRRNDNMQCGSRTRERMGALLADGSVNRWGCRSAAALYARLGGIA